MLLDFALYLLLLLLVVCGYVLWYQRCSKFYGLLRKIPGPRGYPIAGSILANIWADDLFNFGHRKLKEYYPIYKDWWLCAGAVHIQHPDDVEIILSSTEHIEKSFIYKFIQPWLGTGLLTSGGTKWQTRRKLLTPAFHFNSLKDFIAVFNKETEHLVEKLRERCHLSSVNVIPLITELTLKTISETSMGIEMDTSQEDFWNYKKAVHEFGLLNVYRLVRPWLFPDFLFNLSACGFESRALVKVLHAFSTKVIKKRQESYKNPGGSYASKKRLAMLDLLLTAKEGGFDIDDEGIREEVDTFMFEGHDTTSVALCYILLVLANHRDVQDEIHAEIVEVLGDRLPEFNDFKELTYMERCLKECLRLYPSVPFISRLAQSDIRTGTGYTIPQGCLVHVHIYDTHRNPDIYPDPEKFDPNRFLPEATKNRHPFAYVPFSAGPRNCIGQKFAMLELKAVLCGLLRGFILEPVDTLQDLKFKADLVLRTVDENIKVKFLRRGC